jgi:hypothetical protein
VTPSVIIVTLNHCYFYVKNELIIVNNKKYYTKYRKIKLKLLHNKLAGVWEVVLCSLLQIEQRLKVLTLSIIMTINLNDGDNKYV